MNCNTRRSATWLTIIMGAFLLGCEKIDQEGFLGSSVIEGHTFRVSAELGGRLLEMRVMEGEQLARGDTIAIQDTVPLHLELGVLEAGIDELQATLAAKQQEAEVARVEMAGAWRELKRIESLVEKGAVPTQRRDELQTRAASAQARNEGAQLQLQSLEKKISTQRARRMQLLEQLSRAVIISPSRGRVFAVHKSRGEMVRPGQVLVEAAGMDTLEADFYVPQPWLGRLGPGTEVRVRVDGPGGEASFHPARVVWISDEAEFTPKSIQTRETRNELVYRITARAPNAEGVLKRGQPVEIWLSQAPEE